MALIQSLTEYPRPQLVGAEREPYVKVPRFVLDQIGDLSGAELKVLLYVLRRTVGYGEYTPKVITCAEFQEGRQRADGTTLEEGTGLSRAAVHTAIKGLIAKHLLYQEQEEHAPGYYVNRYAVCAPEGGKEQGAAQAEGSRMFRLVGGITWERPEQRAAHPRDGGGATALAEEPGLDEDNVPGGVREGPETRPFPQRKDRGLKRRPSRHEGLEGLKTRPSQVLENLIEIAPRPGSSPEPTRRGPKSGRRGLICRKGWGQKNRPFPTGETRPEGRSSAPLETTARNQELETAQASLGRPVGARMQVESGVDHIEGRRLPEATVIPNRTWGEAYPIVTDPGEAQASSVEVLPSSAGSMSNQSARPTTPQSGSAEPVLQVEPEQLVSWQEDVAEQHQTVARAQAEYERTSAELERCPIGGHDWGELRRQQRFLQRDLEAEQQKLAQFELFVQLIEQGYSKDEACEQVYNQTQCPTEQQLTPEVDSTLESQVEPTLLPVSDKEQTPAPELSPKEWRAALFTGVLALFGWKSQHLNKNSRGLANKAAMLLQESGIRPEQLPRLKSLFERAYPKVTHYTPMALANHATELAAAL